MEKALSLNIIWSFAELSNINILVSLYNKANYNITGALHKRDDWTCDQIVIHSFHFD